MEVLETHTFHALPVPSRTLEPTHQLRLPRKHRNLQRSQAGCLIMNELNLKIICETDGLYEYPQMNKKLYLHYKVIDHIQGLQKYINLKTIYLQNNVITAIQNIGMLTQLQNLFLQNNMIKRIQGLETLKQLKILNLSNNNIFMLEGLADCISLQSLTISKNYLSDFASLEHLGQCSQTLTSIDLSDNRITQQQKLFDLIQQVKCLYLMGNPLVREVLHYRRTLVGRMKNLMYLDQRAVDEEQRMLSQSWVLEGEGGFKRVREQIHSLRKQRKLESRAEIMKNIDVHRKNKINVFEGNIEEAEQQIIKLRGYMREPGNEDQIFFYQNRIAELMTKIRDNQQFIDSLYKRMGIEPLPPVYSIQLAPEQLPSLENEQQTGMFQIREEQQGVQVQSEGHSENESHESSNQTQSIKSGQSSSSQQDSVKTYYSIEQLD